MMAAGFNFVLCMYLGKEMCSTRSFSLLVRLHSFPAWFCHGVEYMGCTWI